MLAGVSTRRYVRTAEPVGADVEAKARSTSKSAASRAFLERTRVALEELMAHRLDDVGLAALMLDGIELKDGSKALRKAIRDVFGQDAPVQRCIRHKERNVLEHLPQRGRPPLKRRLRQAWANPDHKRALDQLHALAAELERSHPGAAGSLHEGLEETLSLTRLGIRGNLKRTLESTNPCESMIEICRPRPRQTRRRNRTRTPSADRPDPEQGARYRPHRLTITPGPPPRKSTAAGTSSRGLAPAAQ